MGSDKGSPHNVTICDGNLTHLLIVRRSKPCKLKSSTYIQHTRSNFKFAYIQKNSRQLIKKKFPVIQHEAFCIKSENHVSNERFKMLHPSHLHLFKIVFKSDQHLIVCPHTFDFP